MEESCSEMLLDCLETTATFAFQQVPASSRFSRQIHFKAMVMSRIGKIILKTYFEFSKRTFLSFIILTLTTPLPRANLITSSLEFLHFFNQCVRHCWQALLEEGRSSCKASYALCIQQKQWAPYDRCVTQPTPVNSCAAAHARFIENYNNCKNFFWALLILFVSKFLLQLAYANYGTWKCKNLMSIE